VGNGTSLLPILYFVLVIHLVPHLFYDVVSLALLDFNFLLAYFGLRFLNFQSVLGQPLHRMLLLSFYFDLVRLANTFHLSCFVLLGLLLTLNHQLMLLLLLSTLLFHALLLLLLLFLLLIFLLNNS
jgi:hypothetical protein